MRAWQVRHHSEPADVLRLVDVERPAPQAGQVLVRVRTVALNFPDVLLCRGQYQQRPELPFTPGVELCGDVVAHGGDGDVHLPVGTRVIGTPSLPDGALAGYALADAGELLAAPDGLDDARAASFHIAYQTGWFGLHRRARLRAGETLLVHAAAGGVGSAAVQLGKAADARVIAVVGGPEKVEVARALGADEVVDRSTTDGSATELVNAVKELTGRTGVDVVYDPVGGDAFDASTKVIGFEGRIVVIGFAGGRIAQAATNHALVKNYGVLGLHWGLYRRFAPQLVQQAHDGLCALVAEGRLDPLVSERVPFADVPDALTRLGSGRSTGRIVVDVQDV